MMPMMGKRKTSTHQRTLCETGRLDWITSTVALSALLASRCAQVVRRLTPDDDVENQDNETNDASADAALPRVLVALSGHRGGCGKGAELQEHKAEDGLEHCEALLGNAVINVKGLGEMVWEGRRWLCRGGAR